MFFTIIIYDFYNNNVWECNVFFKLPDDSNGVGTTGPYQSFEQRSRHMLSCISYSPTRQKGAQAQELALYLSYLSSARNTSLSTGAQYILEWV